MLFEGHVRWFVALVIRRRNIYVIEMIIKDLEYKGPANNKRTVHWSPRLNKWW